MNPSRSSGILRISSAARSSSTMSTRSCFTTDVSICCAVSLATGSIHPPALRVRGETMIIADALLNAISQAVLATDRGGTIVYSNPAADQLYGGDHTSVIGKTVAEVLPEHDV